MCIVCENQAKQLPKLQELAGLIAKREKSVLLGKPEAKDQRDIIKDLIEEVLKIQDELPNIGAPDSNGEVTGEHVMQALEVLSCKVGKGVPL